MSKRIRIDISPELEQWLIGHKYADTLESSVLYVLEQTKRAEDYDRLADQMEKEFPPSDFHEKDR